ncbi:MAG: VCBS repeat-containing protein [Planctomycetes bacterium]|nr:VCBS repeat-containing protein [Planctomycetota bacterium]
MSATLSRSLDRRWTAPKWRLRLLSFIAVILAGLLVYRYGPWHARMSVESARPRSLSVDERLALEHEKNVAIGAMESEDYERADKILADIAARLPQERLGLQNLAVCRLLAFQADRGEAEVAMESVNQLVDRFPESATTHLLASRLHLALMESTSNPDLRGQYLGATFGFLRRAIKLERGSPIRQAVPRYAFYEAARYSDDPEIQRQSRKALDEVQRQNPENLFVIIAWMSVQAKEQDRSIVSTLQNARRTLEPSRDRIRQRAGADVFDFIDRAIHASLSGDWPTVVANARAIGYVVRPDEYAQADKRLISPHPSEYVIHRFSDSFYLGLPGRRAAAGDDPIPHLVPWPSEQQPPPSDVRDLAVADVNLDGEPDLVVLHADRLTVLERHPADNSWGPAIEMPLPQEVDRMILADLDWDDRRPSYVDGPGEHVIPDTPQDTPSDGTDYRSSPCHEADLDVIVYGQAGALVLRNDLVGTSGKRTFTVIEQNEGFLSLSGVHSAALIDLEHDGDLDLILAASARMSIWSNQGDLTFLDVSRWSMLPSPDAVLTQMFVVDWDRDGDLDCLAAGPTSDSVGLLENVHHGQFQWRLLRRTIGRLSIHPESLALLESDGNNSWDLAAAGAEGLQLVRTRSPRPGIVTPLNKIKAMEQPCVVLATWDCDNDGYADLLCSSPDGVFVLRGGFEQGFSDAADIFPEKPPAATRGVPVDLDFDGDLDLALATADGVVLYRNDGGNRNHWLQVRVKGAVDDRHGRVNHYGLGSMLEVRVGTFRQTRMVTGPVTHFGLGRSASADILRVLMTDALPRAVVQPRSDETICEALAARAIVSGPGLFESDRGARSRTGPTRETVFHPRVTAEYGEDSRTSIVWPPPAW